MGQYPAIDDEGDPQCTEHGQLEPCRRCEATEEVFEEDCEEEHSSHCIQRMEVQESLEMGEHETATRWERILAQEVRRLREELKKTNEERRNLLVQRDAALRMKRNGSENETVHRR